MKRLMNAPMKDILDGLRARQLAGEHMPCPRCGRDSMKDDLGAHTKSRYADVCICDECVSSEDGLTKMNVPVNVWNLDWACFKYGIEPTEQTIKEIQERLEGGEIEHLLDYVWNAREQDEADAFWSMFETQRKCPGLYEISADLCRANYKATDGDVRVHFRWRDGKLEYAISAFPKRKLEYAISAFPKRKRKRRSGDEE